MSYLKRIFKHGYPFPKQKSQKRNRSYKEYLHLSYIELKKKETELNEFLHQINNQIDKTHDYYRALKEYDEKKKKLSNELWLELHNDTEYKSKREEIDKLKVQIYDYRYTRFIFKNKFNELDTKKNQLIKELDEIEKVKYIDEIEKRMGRFYEKNPELRYAGYNQDLTEINNKKNDTKRILECVLKAKDIVKKRHDAQQNQIQMAKDETAKHKAHSYAYQEKTRELAVEVKKEIKFQLNKFKVCPYCEGDLGEIPHADHIYPVSKGGLSTKENMVYICQSCNSSKSDKTLNVFIKSKGLDRDKVESNLELLGKDF